MLFISLSLVEGNLRLYGANNGTTFIGVACELKNLFDMLKDQRNEEVISSFCSSQGIIIYVGSSFQSGPHILVGSRRRWLRVQNCT